MVSRRNESRSASERSMNRNRAIGQRELCAKPEGGAMTTNRTFQRRGKDGQGFDAKGRLVKAFLKDRDVTFEEAYHQARLFDGVLMPEEASALPSTVKMWLRNTQKLWDAGLLRGDGIKVPEDITIPKECHPLWRAALLREKGIRI